MTVRFVCLLTAVALFAGCGGSGSPGGTQPPSTPGGESQAAAVQAFRASFHKWLDPLQGEPTITCAQAGSGWRCDGKGVQKQDDGSTGGVEMTGTVSSDGTVKLD